MRKLEITPEIIELSWKIVEHERMEIYEGCWVKYLDEICLIVKIYFKSTSPETGHVYWADLVQEIDGEMSEPFGVAVDDLLPIPTISDALRRLRELKPKAPIRMKICIQILEYLLDKCTFQKLYEFCLAMLLQVLESREGK